MEKTPSTKLQEQVQRVVTPAKKETVQARGWKKETEKGTYLEGGSRESTSVDLEGTIQERDWRFQRAH